MNIKGAFTWHTKRKLVSDFDHVIGILLPEYETTFSEKGFRFDTMHGDDFNVVSPVKLESIWHHDPRFSELVGH